MAEIKWTFEACKEEALKYSTKRDFMKNSYPAYYKAWSKKWLNDICTHMEKLRSEKKYHTYEECKEIALKCKTRQELSEKYHSIYWKAYHMRWLDDICSHMKKKKQYTFEECLEIAKIYDNLTDFRKNDIWIFNYAKKKNWLNDISANFKRSPNIKWTDNLCREEAKKYKTRGEFAIKCNNGYTFAIRHGILEDVCSHMLSPLKYPYEVCHATALKYNTTSEFMKNERPCYSMACRQGWLKDICKHMCKGKKWNYIVCKETALKYQTVKDFRLNERLCYLAVRRNGWLYDLCYHMKDLNTSKKYMIEYIKTNPKVAK